MGQALGKQIAKNDKDKSWLPNAGVSHWGWVLLASDLKQFG